MRQLATTPTNKPQPGHVIETCRHALEPSQENETHAPNTTREFSRAFHEQNNEKHAITHLPAEGCTLPIPPIPTAACGQWNRQQKTRWKELWQSPQATQWDDSVSGTVALLVTSESQLLSGSGAT